MSQHEIREQVTQKIIAALEKDLLPWRKMWKGGNTGGPHFNAMTGKAYRGVNVLLLSIAAMEHGFQSNAWGTFNQWKQMGCCIQRRPDDVPPGQWGTTLAVYIPITKKSEDPAADEDEEETFWMLKKFTVFNANQVNGATAEQFQFVAKPDTALHTEPDYEPAEQLIQATGADIRFGGNRACYSIAGDFICLPPKSSFIGGAYYATALHELAHWSECRVGWERKENNYAMGELIAEMASCFLATELGVPNSESLENHASYIKRWLQDMKDDPNYIFKASRQASKVCDFLVSFVKKDETELQPELVEAA